MRTLAKFRIFCLPFKLARSRFPSLAQGTPHSLVWWDAKYPFSFAKVCIMSQYSSTFNICSRRNERLSQKVVHFTFNINLRRNGRLEAKSTKRVKGQNSQGCAFQGRLQEKLHINITFTSREEAIVLCPRKAKSREVDYLG